MGFLTTVTFYNDALGEIKEDPEGFGEAVLDAKRRAGWDGRAASAGVGHYLNAVKVQPSRHADDETLYIHSGNTVLDLGGADFEELLERNPKLARDFVERAEGFLEYVRRKLG